MPAPTLSVLSVLCLMAMVNARIGNHQIFQNMGGSCGAGDGFSGIETWFFGAAFRARTWDFQCRKVFDSPTGENCDWFKNINGWNAYMDFNCPTGSYIAGTDCGYNWWKRDYRYGFKCCSPKTPYTCTAAHGTHAQSGRLAQYFKIGVSDWTLTGIQSDYDHGYGDRNFVFKFSGLECSDTCNCPGIADSAWRVVDVEYDLQAAKKSSAKPVVLHTQIFENNSGGMGNSRFTFSKAVRRGHSFSHKAGTSITIGTSFKVGIPNVVEITGSVEVSGSYDYTWGESNEITTQFGSWSSVDIPPYSRVKLTSEVQEYQLNVPYKIILEREGGCRCESEGEWSGVQLMSQTTHADMVDEDGNVIMNGSSVAVHSRRSLGNMVRRTTAPECRMDSEGWGCTLLGVRMSEFQEFVYPMYQMDEARKMMSRDAEDCFNECRDHPSCAGVVRQAGLGLTQEGDCYYVTVSDLENCDHQGSGSGFPVVWIERGREHSCLHLAQSG